MDSSESASATASPATDNPASTPESPPAVAASGAQTSATSAVAAPAAAGSAVSKPSDPATVDPRNAFARLRHGETPQQIRENPKGPATTTKAKPQEQQPPDAEQPAQAESATEPSTTETGTAKLQEHTADSLGLSEKEFNAAKRGHLDPETLAQIPPTNRKAVVRNLMASQAEADRQFQAAKAATKAEAKTEPDGTKAPPANPATAAPPRQQEATTPAAVPDFKFELSAADRKTLSDIAGEEFADAQQRLLNHIGQAAAQHVLTAVQSQLGQFAPQVQQSLQFNQALAGYVEQREFKSAVSALKSDPFYAKLGKPETQALFDKTGQLLRASGDPEYGIDEAVRDAARVLFQPNVQQTAQANLAQSKAKALAGSPDKGSGQREQPRTLTETEQMKEAFKRLAARESPKSVNRAIYG